MIYDNIKQVNININKKLSENIIKTAKSICTLGSYGNFLNKVFNIPFVYDDLVELNIGIKNYEDMTENPNKKLYEKGWK